jgi:dienelactone hydrolase
VEMVLVLLLILVTVAPAMSATLSVGPVTDARLHARRGTDTRFELKQPGSLVEWQMHADAVRERILAGCGLNPMPARTPLNARVFGKIDRGDYTVENVYFQSYPGFYVVGNLYRPKGKAGPFPAVLCPHGHGAGGRLEMSADLGQPLRAISIAKLGMVAFSYSMIGYNENTHIQHRFAASPRQELWGIGPGALQLWNSIRAVDFVSSLPEVDRERIGCTGESGGGTQTFILSAVDPRIKVNSPVCMISATMQGGCVCENGPLWRIDSNSVEIGALMAPRPMMMIAATGDWTNETMEHEYPFTRGIYKLYGAESNVNAWLQDAGHNYNMKSREHVYPWLQHFLLGDKSAGETTPEGRVAIENTDDFIAYKTPPKDALTVDRLTENLIAARKGQIDGFTIGSRSSLDRYRRTFGPALRACLAVSVPAAADIVVDRRGSVDLANCSVSKLVIGRKGIGDAIPALLLVPKTRIARAAPVVVVHSEGKLALLSGDAPGDRVNALLARGRTVLAVDTFRTGETDKNDERMKQTFFTTFYRTDAAERVQDIVTALNYVAALTQEPQALSRLDRAVSKGAAVDLIGIGSSGLDCLFARAFAGVAGSTVVDADGFDASDDQAFVDRFFVPCIRRVGDVRTAAALVAPRRLTICNPGKGFPSGWMKRAYAASGAPKALAVTDSSPGPMGLEDGL